MKGNVRDGMTSRSGIMRGIVTYNHGHARQPRQRRRTARDWRWSCCTCSCFAASAFFHHDFDCHQNSRTHCTPAESVSTPRKRKSRGRRRSSAPAWPAALEACTTHPLDTLALAASRRPLSSRLIDLVQSVSLSRRFAAPAEQNRGTRRLATCAVPVPRGSCGRASIRQGVRTDACMAPVWTARGRVADVDRRSRRCDRAGARAQAARLWRACRWTTPCA